MNKQKLLMGIAVAFLVGGAMGWGARSISPTKFSGGTVYSPPAAELRDNIRKLWTDHIVWTRLFIISTLSKSNDVEKVTDRLFKNQTEIGNVFKPYYGVGVGERLGKLLLRDHILIAADIVGAAQVGNQGKLGILEKRWKKNAEDIADFLSALNPHWKHEELLDMLLEHLRYTKEELVARLEKNYDKDIDAFDEAIEDALKMADLWSDGVIQQFPEKFKP